ncbi:MAG: S1C family serine protease [Kofleriaceae bacterium]
MKKSIVSAVLVIAAQVGVSAADPAPRSGSQVAPPGSNYSVQIRASQGRLGVSVLQISSELRSYLGGPADRGVLVDAVRPDSPAAKAGVRVGDIVTDVDGAPATSADEMLDAMSDRNKGDAIKVKVVRNKQRIELTATLVDEPGPRISRQFQTFGNMPDADRWFRSFGSPQSGLWRQDLQDRIDELEKRLEKLEKI